MWWLLQLKVAVKMFDWCLVSMAADWYFPLMISATLHTSSFSSSPPGQVWWGGGGVICETMYNVQQVVKNTQQVLVLHVCSKNTKLSTLFIQFDYKFTKPQNAKSKVLN